ncbi:MAG: protein phosphatase 2C domain-containing protein [Gemmataceae bacterium]|nr:protein phosphatase 2C domain-containing protein [Gemmataceae bacterium]
MNPGSPGAALPARATLPDGSLLDLSAFGERWPADPWRPLDLPHQGRLLRVHALDADWLADLAPQLAARRAAPLDVLPPLQVVPHAGGALVVREKGPSIPFPASDDPADVLAACALLADPLERLHDAGLLWLQFDPEAVEAGPRLGNLDLGLHFQGACPDGLPVSPWSSPEVAALDAGRLGPASDVWSLALFAYLRFACLRDGFPGQGPAAFGYRLPPLRVYAPHLAPGLEPVLRRALRTDARQRTGSVRDFMARFAQAVEEAERRSGWRAGVRVVHQAATRTGHVHSLRGQPNQDGHAVLETEDDLAAIVCDGVTHALIGSGDLASRTAIGSFAESLPGLLRGAEGLEDRAVALVQAFETAGRAVLARTLLEPLGRLATDPSDLMSTTAVVALVTGSELLLANAGDSRAYLVRHGTAEQLTVDGDVRCVSLMMGKPPEDVLELGSTAQALYHCLGVGTWTGKGMAHDDERCIPSLYRMGLLPGDRIVLCTDGLVEEGVFLSQEDLPSLGSAEEMAEAACARHAEPSPTEPEGRGDDVTVVVLDILPE